MSAIDLAAVLVRQFEGCRLTAYQDSGGVWTIGWGHTGRDVFEGLSWTQQAADTALATDLRIASEWASKLAPGLVDVQLAALTSLVFNVGAAALKGSGLLRAIHEARWIDAAHEFVRWDHVGKREVRGLLRRRLTEAALFLNF